MAMENNGVVSDFPKAARYFKQAADLGDPDGAYALGLLFRNGTGVEKSDKRAAEWIARPPTKAMSRPRSNMPSCCSTAAASTRTRRRPRSFFSGRRRIIIPSRRTAWHGCSPRGRGIRKNMVEAMKWHLLARTAGLNDAWLDSKLEQLSPDEKAAVSAAVRQYVGN